MKGYLLLANGQLYEGTLMGAAKPVMAELVFTTAMTGYLETLTDPSYEGEIVIQTFPTIGNYGVIPEDFESPRPRLSAYIVRELCDEPSNFRCQGKLDDYLKAQGIPCLTGVDTRAADREAGESGGNLRAIEGAAVPSVDSGRDVRRRSAREEAGNPQCRPLGLRRKGEHPA